jgi:hypothetical protein
MIILIQFIVIIPELMLFGAGVGLDSRPGPSPVANPSVAQGRELGLVRLDFSKYIYLLCGKIVITEYRKMGWESEHFVGKKSGFK